MKKLFILLTAVSLLSCSEEDLGKGYYYLPADEALDIGYPYGAIVYQSSAKNSYQNVLIYADVVQCVSDSRYILAAQKPNKRLMEKYHGDQNDSIFNNNTSLKSMFKNKLNYYLIDKERDTMYGPLSEKALLKAKTEHGVELTFDR
ncbi:DUF3997 domain-containing protein [Pedobacter heparinus]|uniref:DUF3997 domain-containing protein n=1 Tax=Pedobacter heparinus TaxID=984 RepID=UPI00292EFA46|nr:DUF3997 domain-containing protein [Pedobacter heparinus]